MGSLRALWRGTVFFIIAILAIATYSFRRDKSLRGRAQWMQHWSGVALRVIGVHVRVVGEPPRDGLLVSNHMGYLDVLAIGAAAPFAFVSKSEVAAWPLVGSLTRRAGTIFVDRGSRAATSSVTGQIEERLEAGVPVVLFPEGTSTDGSHLLPFHSSLFEAPVTLQAPIHPVAVRYSVPGDVDGSIMRERVAYWGEMTFAGQLPKLLALPRVDVVVEFLPQAITAQDRKTAAAEAESAIRRALAL